MEYGKQTINHYERTAREFAGAHGKVIEPPVHLLKMFGTSLPGIRVLEVGFGLGTDAKWFVENGYDYTGVEPAQIYHDLLNEGPLTLSVIKKDIRRTTFKEGSFDGIWARNTFLHFNDSDFAKVAADCQKWLHPNGVLYLSVKEGLGEETKPDGRYFNYFTNQKVRDLVPDGLSVAGFLKTQPDKTYTSDRPILNFYFRKAVALPDGTNTRLYVAHSRNPL